MDKIIVIGSPGGGKSHFSRALSRITGIPVYHMDNLHWRADKTYGTREELIEKVNAIIKGDRWIIDGNYNGTLEQRIAACNTVFWLDLPVEVCLEGIRGRIGTVREDMPWVETEIDEEFMDFVRDFPTESRPKIVRLLDEYPEKRVIRFSSRQETEEFLEKLETKR